MRGFENWSANDVKRHNERIKSTKAINNIPQKEKSIVDKPRASKYHNVKVEVDGIKYDSKKEAKRGAELEQLERLGLIKNLERQKKYVLQPSFKFLGRTIREIAYVADFVYEENGNIVVEDTKSSITLKNPVYLIKKKMMMYVYGIEIKEV